MSQLNKTSKSFTTKIIHPEFPHKEVFNAVQMPVYENVSFEFDTAEEMADAFVGRSDAFSYSRISNPTVQHLEKQITEITGALSTTALNSGMAAISNTFIELAYAGSNIVTSPHLFGNTYSFFISTLAAFGVETRFCDLTNLDEVEKNIDENTCALFLEVLTNPHLEIVDLRKIAALAKSKGVPTIADTTVIPFIHFKAKEYGVNIELISSTKYLSGGGTSLGGLIVDFGTFDWNQSKKLAPMAKSFGQLAFTAKLKKEIHRNLGGYMSPQAAHMQSLGLETLEIRYKQAATSCAKLANELQTIKGIISVNYTGLPENPFHELSKAQFGELPGAMLCFSLESKEACFSFLNRLKMIKRSTNLFDNRSLIIHPASTIYGNFTDEARKAMDIDDRQIRLSVGLEDHLDLLADINQALGN